MHLKKIVLIFLKIFISSTALTSLTLFIGDRFGGIFWKGSLPPLIYLAFVTISGAIFLELGRVPRLNTRRIAELLSTEGYCPEVYALLADWNAKCEKRGCGELSRLVTAQFLIDGGHFKEGFGTLGKLDFEALDRRQKQVYMNTYLYGAVMLGDKPEADRIFASGEKWLTTVTDKHLAASVKHTLASYEYMCGNKVRAEELFMQSIGCTTARDVLCEDWLGLAACYLDSGRKEQARMAVKTAAEKSVTTVQDERVKRAKHLVEQAYNIA
ncbi:hypothetical protein SAMN02910447_00065 [Ruminococcus sp. YE71]|uniref:hypothetical protein n=1 Tax=unclassified Ruminococcus TaxID=2608920 RepID=UPI000891EAD3|nr:MULTISPECIES: hypothetical protein [unclassified Ruminococcus]SDA10223.1 hypothetical protein SAMN02910446_00284 [Ruminococcus sp. YE78]SFW10978.1 hypothetical protein SAMN02910447_00065 [Ruminococcus sp. YE71]